MKMHGRGGEKSRDQIETPSLQVILCTSLIGDKTEVPPGQTGTSKPKARRKN